MTPLSCWPQVLGYGQNLWLVVDAPYVHLKVWPLKKKNAVLNGESCALACLYLDAPALEDWDCLFLRAPRMFGVIGCVATSQVCVCISSFAVGLVCPRNPEVPCRSAPIRLNAYHHQTHFLYPGGGKPCKSSNEIGTLQLLLRELSVFKAISRSNRGGEKRGRVKLCCSPHRRAASPV